jgi:anti-sigma B factor antagonist
MTMIRLREFTDSDLIVVEPGERLTIDNAHELTALIRTVSPQIAPSMIIDLGRTSFIDSTGIGALVNLQKHVQQLNGRCAIVCPSPKILRMFQLMNLHHVFDLFESVELAAHQIASTTTSRSGS